VGQVGACHFPSITPCQEKSCVAAVPDLQCILLPP
jgi:hypothetical protein